jgi:hypothetical protein
MTITPLALSAWISLYCGFCLLRSSVPPYRRDHVRFGKRRKRAFAGCALLLLGVMVLVAALLRHM